MLTADEKREMVNIATSNRRVSGKNVYLEPSTWLLSIQACMGVSYCAQPRPTSRRRPELSDQQLEALIEAAQSDAATRIEAVFANKDDPLTMER